MEEIFRTPIKEAGKTYGSLKFSMGPVLRHEDRKGEKIERKVIATRAEFKNRKGETTAQVIKHVDDNFNYVVAFTEALKKLLSKLGRSGTVSPIFCNFLYKKGKAAIESQKFGAAPSWASNIIICDSIHAFRSVVKETDRKIMHNILGLEFPPKNAIWISSNKGLYSNGGYSEKRKPRHVLESCEKVMQESPFKSGNVKDLDQEAVFKKLDDMLEKTVEKEVKDAFVKGFTTHLDPVERIAAKYGVEGVNMLNCSCEAGELLDKMAYAKRILELEQEIKDLSKD